MVTAEPHHTPWQPEFATPQISVYGIEELSGKKGDGLALSRWLIENSTPLEFPATDPSTLVDAEERELRTFKMRYTGPNFFAAAEAPQEVRALHSTYMGQMRDTWEQEFGLDVRPLDLDERAAEAFITNPGRGEGGDPHNDTYLTCAGYPAAGAALIVSHCINARNIRDIEEQPSTLVLPRPQSLVFFMGTVHPHVGVSPNSLETDSPETRRSKFRALVERFNIVRRVQNFYIPDRFGTDDPASRGPAAIPNLLTSWGALQGDRPVLSFNFDDSFGAGSTLDSYFREVA